MTLETLSKDPLGIACLKYIENTDLDLNITVEAIDFEDDIFPVAYLFRNYDLMPDLEKIAMGHCEGKILDVGAGVGCHSQYLKSKGLDVEAVEPSPGACEILGKLEIPFHCISILDYQPKTKYDTILLLMNGLGLAATKEHLPSFLSHLKSLLTDNGKIICDSCNLDYLYEGLSEEETEGLYPGEITYRMSFENASTDWFNWLYIKFEELEEVCLSLGLNATLIYEGKQNEYLTQITKNENK